MTVPAAIFAPARRSAPLCFAPFAAVAPYSMAPRKGETQLQKASRLREASRKLEESARFNRVCAVLKDHPAATARIENDLLKDGLLQPEGDRPDAKPAPPAPPAPLAVCDAGDTASAGLEKEITEKVGDHAQQLIMALPMTAYDRNTSRYGQVGVKIIETALTCFNRITYSTGNLRAIIPAGKRLQNKNKIWEVMEFNTNIGEDDPIPASRRCDRFVVEDLVRAYVANDMPGSNLALPPNWLIDGVYTCSVVGTTCTVKNKLTGAEGTVAIPRLAEPYIDIPFSQTRAILRVNGNSCFRKRIITIMDKTDEPEESFVIPTPGKDAPAGGHRGLHRRLPSKVPPLQLAIAPHGDAENKRKVAPSAGEVEPAAKASLTTSKASSANDGSTGSSWGASASGAEASPTKSAEAMFRPKAPVTKKKAT